ncbi:MULTISPECIES: hypothetical protein [Vagococcus]|uniref:Gram-positive cocci surface proteins LPxTG domain-containing protein n=1 Tax=Vagococcus fluvialis bH819 TaxID=1255619 RepID=A0A1X6WM65_9ENTE|nr:MULTISPECIES: hypothetical protein [Vagococcus]SLM85338.1 hypothetical protein FM121_04520 [Vagococcus fluvialis bH819]HCM89368.1 hypothetical protein [Vagococcus sp.]
MRKRVITVVLLMFGLLCTNTFSYAQDQQNNPKKEGDTEVNVHFSKDDIKKDKIKPSVYKPEVKPTVSELLPRTNEMLQTLLFLLIGIALIVLIFGLLMFKKIYNKKVYAFF